MMKCATAAEMRAMDACAIHEHGIPEIELMRRAAAALQHSLFAAYGKRRRYGIFCGCGNNNSCGCGCNCCNNGGNNNSCGCGCDCGCNNSCGC